MTIVNVCKTDKFYRLYFFRLSHFNLPIREKCNDKLNLVIGKSYLLEQTTTV